MKRLLLICVMVLTTSVLLAQERAAIIKLKGGAEVKGTIIEEIADQSISIRTAEGDVFVYRPSEILHIENPNAAQEKAEKAKKEMEAKLAQKEAEIKAKLEAEAAKQTAKESAKTAKKAAKEERALGNFKGYRGIINLDGGINMAWNEEYVVAKFSFINGYNFGPHFYMGVGVGIDLSYYYHSWSEEETYSSYNSHSFGYSLPIFLHLRTSWAKNCKVSPFLSLSLGYCISLSDVQHCANEQHYYEGSWGHAPDAKGCVAKWEKAPNRLYAEPTFGLEFRTSRKRAITIAVTSPIKLNPTNLLTNFDYERLCLPICGQLGFSF